MSSQEKQIKTGTKPAIYSIAAVFILFFASLMTQHSENPFVYFFANLYLFPFHLEFSKAFSVFIAAVISSVIAFPLYLFGFWDIKTKSRFYIVNTILAYVVYTGAWYFVKTMGFALKDIFSFESIIPGIVLLMASILFVYILCFLHFSMTKEIYETEFLEESEAYQANKRLENINAHKRKTHEQQEKKKPSASNITAPEYTENRHMIYRISDQEAINNLYKGLEKVEQLINMNLTSDAASNLRLVSEHFTKQISIHNELFLEKMDQYSRVQSLYEDNYISEELYNLLSTIRKLGNRAVHEFGDEERFNKNGLLKLRRQLLGHLEEWVINEQNEVAASVDEHYDDEYEYDEDDEYEYDEYEYDEDDDDYDDDDEDDEYENVNQYDNEDNEFGVEDENKESPQRYSAPRLLTKEKKEKMKF